jgi:hypothetical protein
MVYGVRVAETRLEQNLTHLTYVLNYYRLYQDHSTKQLGLQHNRQIGISWQYRRTCTKIICKHKIRREIWTSFGNDIMVLFLLTAWRSTSACSLECVIMTSFPLVMVSTFHFRLQALAANGSIHDERGPNVQWIYVLKSSHGFYSFASSSLAPLLEQSE